LLDRKIIQSKSKAAKYKIKIERILQESEDAKLMKKILSEENQLKQ
jgi:hypothetical protein